MSSRRRRNVPPVTQVAEPAVPPSPRRRFLVVGIALVAGVVLGGVVGAVFFFTHRVTVDLGTIGTMSVGEHADDKAIYATYAGSSSCQACHAKEYELWSTSHHGLAERPVDPATDKAAFVPPRT